MRLVLLPHYIYLRARLVLPHTHIIISRVPLSPPQKNIDLCVPFPRPPPKPLICVGRSAPHNIYVLVSFFPHWIYLLARLVLPPSHIIILRVPLLPPQKSIDLLAPFPPPSKTIDFCGPFFPPQHIICARLVLLPHYIYLHVRFSPPLHTHIIILRVPLSPPKKY